MNVILKRTFQNRWVATVVLGMALLCGRASACELGTRAADAPVFDDRDGSWPRRAAAGEGTRRRRGEPRGA